MLKLNFQIWQLCSAGEHSALHMLREVPRGFCFLCSYTITSCMGLAVLSLAKQWRFFSFSVHISIWYFFLRSKKVRFTQYFYFPVFLLPLQQSCKFHICRLLPSSNPLHLWRDSHLFKTSHFPGHGEFWKVHVVWATCPTLHTAAMWTQWRQISAEVWPWANLRAGGIKAEEQVSSK